MSEHAAASGTRCPCGRKCEQPQPVRHYVVGGLGGMSYVRDERGEIADIAADVADVLDGDLDELLIAQIRRRAEVLGEWGR